MHEQTEAERAEARDAVGTPDRVLWHRCLLALNLSIVAFSVYVVWTKLATADERTDEARSIPLYTPTTAGVSPRTSSGDRRAADPSVEREERSPGKTDRSGGGSEPRVAPRDVATDGLGADPPRVADDTAPPSDVATVPPSSAEPPEAPPPRGDVPEGVPAADAVEPEPRVPLGPPDEATKRRIRATRRRIGEIGVQLELVHNKDGAYPTSDRDFGAHRGVEALLVALLTHDRGEGLDLGDSDSDGRLEVLDAWGRPLLYFSGDDYDRSQSWTTAGRRAVRVAPARSRLRGSPHARARYQLWSVGRNGRDEGGRGDDITSWVLRD